MSFRLEQFLSVPFVLGVNHFLCITLRLLLSLLQSFKDRFNLVMLINTVSFYVDIGFGSI
jgi:hypothetical protein